MKQTKPKYDNNLYEEQTENELLDKDNVTLSKSIIEQIQKQILNSVTSGNTSCSNDWISILNEFRYGDRNKDFRLVMEVLDNIKRR